jgi:hypothetical protein
MEKCVPTGRLWMRVDLILTKKGQYIVGIIVYISRFEYFVPKWPHLAGDAGY